jgi:hypothetical protein
MNQRLSQHFKRGMRSKEKKESDQILRAKNNLRKNFYYTYMMIYGSYFTAAVSTSQNRHEIERKNASDQISGAKIIQEKSFCYT